MEGEAKGALLVTESSNALIVTVAQGLYDLDREASGIVRFDRSSRSTSASSYSRCDSS